MSNSTEELGKNMLRWNTYMIHAPVSIITELYCTRISISSEQESENSLRIRLIAAVLQASEKLHATKKCAFLSLSSTLC